MWIVLFKVKLLLFCAYCYNLCFRLRIIWIYISLNSSQNSFYISKYWKNHSKSVHSALFLGPKKLSWILGPNNATYIKWKIIIHIFTWLPQNRLSRDSTFLIKLKNNFSKKKWYFFCIVLIIIFRGQFHQIEFKQPNLKKKNFIKIPNRAWEILIFGVLSAQLLVQFWGACGRKISQ